MYNIDILIPIISSVTLLALKNIYSSNKTLLYALHCNVNCLGAATRKQISNANISGSFSESVLFCYSLVAHQHWDVCHTVIELFLFPRFAFRACFINHLSKHFPNCYHIAKYVTFVYEYILRYWWERMTIARRPASHISRKRLICSNFKYTPH